MNTKFNTVKTVNSTTSFLNTLSVKNLEEKIKDYLNEYLVFNELSKLTLDGKACHSGNVNELTWWNKMGNRFKTTSETAKVKLDLAYMVLAQKNLHHEKR